MFYEWLSSLGQWMSSVWAAWHNWLVSIPGFFESINGFFWVGANLLIAYIAAILVVFIITYYALFDVKTTTAGKFIFRFVLSLIGVIGLVFISIFLDPSRGHHWAENPDDVLWWRPLVRFVIYGYVAYAVSALVVLVVLRKWWPEKLHTEKTRQLLETRK